MSGGYPGRNSSRYDPADFVVPPELEKGKSERVQCYIQSGHARALAIIARSGVFPFERESDVVRWCIKYGLEKLDTLEPQLINSVMRRTNMLIELTREEIAQQKFLESFSMLERAIGSHIGRGDEHAAKDLVGRWRKEILAMPDEPEREARWKMRYLNELEGKYRHLVEFGGNER